MITKYLKELNWSIIPVNEEKKPLIPWKIYQERHPTIEEVLKWQEEFKDCGWAVVCGKISNLSIVDFDSDNIIENYLEFNTPIVKTPRGYHLYFQFCNEASTGRLDKHLDIRSEGGYAIIPPTQFGEKTYQWLKDPFSIKPAPFPDQFKSIQVNYEFNPQILQNYFVQGRRDNDLFHIAYSLFKAGVEKDMIAAVIYHLARSCQPPFPEKEAIRKVISAFRFSEEKKEYLTSDIKTFISLVSGWFSVRDIFRELGIINSAQRKAVYVILNRLVEEGLIQRSEKRAGYYIRVDRELKPLSLEPIEEKPYELLWPLGLENLIEIYPKNIIVLAGVQNSGKTAFLLNFVAKNMGNYRIHYFNSEMSQEEFSRRLRQFKDVQTWTFNAYERCSNFAQAIFPDDINVIDYLMINENFWEIGLEIQKIHERLNKGIAVIAVQKESYKELGRGAGLGLDIPRLYLVMNPGELRIIKAKNWKKPDVNPNGIIIKFKLVGGWKFIGEVWK